MLGKYSDLAVGTTRNDPTDSGPYEDEAPYIGCVRMSLGRPCLIKDRDSPVSDDGESASVTESKSTSSLPGNNVNNCVEELTGLAADVTEVHNECPHGNRSTLLATGHVTTARDRDESCSMLVCFVYLLYPDTDEVPKGALHSDCPYTSRDCPCWKSPHNVARSAPVCFDEGTVHELDLLTIHEAPTMMTELGPWTYCV